MEPKTTSWVVVGLGVVVSIIGQMSRPVNSVPEYWVSVLPISSWESWICLDPQSDRSPDAGLLNPGTHYFETYRDS